MKRLLFFSFILIALLITACSKSEITAQTAHAEPIVLGADFPMTGGSSVYGEPLLEGLQLGVDEVNKQGGVNGRPLKILLEDNTGKAPNSVSIAQKMIDVDNVDMLLTTIMPMAGAVAPVAESSQKVLLYAAAVDTLAEKNTWVFKDSVDAYYDCKVLAKRALDNGMKTFALLGANAEFTTKCKEALDDELAANGDLVSYELYNIGDTDYHTQLTKIKAKSPDAVFLSAFSNDCIQIWKQIKELAVMTTYFLPFTQTGCGEDKAAHELEGLDSPVIGLEFAFDKNSKEYQTFIANFHTKYNKEPSLLFLTLLGYDWAHYIAGAFEKCPDASDSHCLRAALEKTEHQGALGHVTYKPQHTTFRPRKLIAFEGAWTNLK